MSSFRLLILLIMLAIAGCQDQADSGNANLKSAVFLDDPIEGVEYTRTSSSEILTTGEGGVFLYKDGDTVTFKLGELILGSIDSSMIPSSRQVWPKDIAGGDVELESDIALLLQQLGKDENEQKIKIAPEILAYFKNERFKGKNIRDFAGEASIRSIVNEASTVSGAAINETITYSDAISNLRVNEVLYAAKLEAKSDTESNESFSSDEEAEEGVVGVEDLGDEIVELETAELGTQIFKYSVNRLKSEYETLNAKIPSTPVSIKKLISDMDNSIIDTQSDGVSAEEKLEKTINTLTEQLNSTGGTSAILRVQVPFFPEGTLSEAQTQDQRQKIEAAKLEVIGRLATVAPSIQGKTGDLGSTPYIEITVNTQQELDAVLSTEGIMGIEVNEVHPPALMESNTVIGSQLAWSTGAKGENTVVAILDTGVNKTHPFLSGKVVSEACYSKAGGAASGTSLCPGSVTSSTAVGSGVNCSSGTSSSCDHGTHVAGISAGKGDTFSGVAPEAKIIAIQVFTKTGTGSVGAYDTDIIKGLERVYALRSTYNIASANMSLGGGKYTAACDSAGYWEGATKTAIDNLLSVNIPTVIASGNESYTNALAKPACISTSLSVGSSGDGSGGAIKDKVSSFSNSASFLDLLAPGQVIYSASYTSTYQNKQGTSMAAPQVAGALAVLKSQASSASAIEMINALKTTGTNISDYRNGIVKPRINVNSAITALGKGDLSATLSPAGAVTGGAKWSVDNLTWQDSGSSLELPIGSYTIYFKSATHSDVGKSWITPASISATVSKDATTNKSATYEEGAPKPLPMTDLDSNSKADKILINVSDNRLITLIMDGSTITTTQTLKLNGVDFKPSTSSWSWWQTADLDGDGKSDIVLRNTKDNRLYIFIMDGHDVDSYKIMQVNGVDYKPSVSAWVWWGATDLNGDGKSDLILRNKSDNRLITLLMDGSNVTSVQTLQINGTDYKPGTSSWAWWTYTDLDGDEKSDLILRNIYDNRLITFLMDGHSVASRQALQLNGVDYKPSTASWAWFRATDLNGDGKSDLILRNKSDNRLYTYLMDGHAVSSYQVLKIGGKDYKPGISAWAWWTGGDFNGDGKNDLTLRNVKDNRLIIFLMDGHSVLSNGVLKSLSNVDYKPSPSSWVWFQSIDINNDKKSDLMLRNKSDNRLLVLQMNGLSMTSSQVVQLNGADYKPSPASWSWWR